MRGQIVVHSGSLNETTTTLPRSERSETRLPNWSVSVKPGAVALSAVYPLLLLPLGFYLPVELRRLRALVTAPR